MVSTWWWTCTIYIGTFFSAGGPILLTLLTSKKQHSHTLSSCINNASNSEKDANYNVFVVSYIPMLWVALVCHWPTNFYLIERWFHGMIYSVPCYYDTKFSWLYRNIRKKDITKFHIQLVLSMLLMFLSNLINYIFNTDLNIFLGQCICVLVSFLWYHILVVESTDVDGSWRTSSLSKTTSRFKKTTTLYITVVSLIRWGEYTTKGGHHNAGSIMLNHYYQSFCPDNLNHKPCQSHHSTTIPT